METEAQIHSQGVRPEPCNDQSAATQQPKGLARVLTRIIDYGYLPPLRRFIPRQTFRYAVCGGGNLVLNWVLYALLYNVIIDKRFIDLGIVVVSPHIAAFLISFPITFFTGFWLQKNIAFRHSPLRSRTQLLRYLLSVAGSIVLNYVGLKLFVEICHIYPTPSQVLISLISIAYSYLMQKYFTFRGCEPA